MNADLHRALETLELPADWIGIRAVQDRSTYRFVRDGMPQSNHTEQSRGVMVEVMAAGQIGYGATNSTRPEAIHSAAKQAYQQAIAASHWAIHPMTPAVRPKVSGHFIAPFEKPLDALSVAEISDVLVRLCQTLKVSEAIVQTSATAVTQDVETWFVSSNGSDAYQRTLYVQTQFGAIAQDGSTVQQRSHNGGLANCYQGGWERFPIDSLWTRAEDIGHQAVELLTADDCPTETTTLVLAPEQMMLQIHESIGHPLELDRILGDERNYAGGSFVKPEDFGALQYGSSLMNITFNPTVPGEFASYPFDDIGAVATKEYLIQNGRLLRGLGSLESQQRSGLPGVACARATSWNRPPIDRMANLNLEPGTDSFEALLRGIESGVYMEANRSWSIDDQRYKFQFGCEYARKIENGRLTKPLRNPNYRGTTPQFWNRLARVGQPDTWEMYGTPYCGKGEPNQAIRVGHGSPVCVFEDIEVFGGAT